MPPTTGVERNRVLDLLRLVAAVAVVLYHLTWHGWAIDHTSPVQYPSILTAVTRYGFLGVELFFVISGMVILATATGRTARQFAASRVARLFPAFWALVTLTFVVTRVAGAHSLQVGIGDYVVNLSMLEELIPHQLHQFHMVDSVYWTLTVELVFYVLIWTVVACKQLHRIVELLAGWLLFSVVAEIGHVGPTDIVRRYTDSQYACWFVAGACLSLIGAGDRRRRVGLLFAIASLVSMRQAALAVRDAALQAPGAYHPWVGAVAAVIVLTVVAVVALSRLGGAGSAWMTTAGLLTYPLYLAHENIGLTLDEHLGHLDRWLALAGVSLAVTAVAWATHVLVERPLGPRLRHWLNDRHAARLDIAIPLARS